MSDSVIRRAVLSRPLGEVRIFHRRWKAGLGYHPLVSAFLRENHLSPELGTGYLGSVWPQIFSRTAAAQQRRRESEEAALRAEMARRAQLSVQLLDSLDAEAVEAIVAEHGDDVLAAYKAELARVERRWGAHLPVQTCAAAAAGVLGVAHELRDEEARRAERAAAARRWARRAEEEDDLFFF